jgi:hypothetical protein
MTIYDLPERRVLSDAEKVARWNLLLRADLLHIVLTTSSGQHIMISPEGLETFTLDSLARVLECSLGPVTGTSTHPGVTDASPDTLLPHSDAAGDGPGSVHLPPITDSASRDSGALQGLYRHAVGGTVIRSDDIPPEVAHGCPTKVNANWEARR